jgi:hypothetical protein
MLERDDVQMMLEEIQRQLQVMYTYIQIRHDMEDWHGVMDASADIRELKAKEQALREVLEVK